MSSEHVTHVQLEGARVTARVFYLLCLELGFDTHFMYTHSGHTVLKYRLFVLPSSADLCSHCAKPERTYTITSASHTMVIPALVVYESSVHGHS